MSPRSVFRKTRASNRVFLVDERVITLRPAGILRALGHNIVRGVDGMYRHGE